MTMKFKDSINKDVENLKNEYFEAVRNDADPETIENKYAEYMAAFSSNLQSEVLKEAREEVYNTSTDKQVRMNRGENILTAEESRFFTNLVEDDANLDTYKEEVILPESTVLRVFEDMQKARPLLSKINFQIAGIKTRLIVGDPKGAAVWGEVFGKIQGQIQANFKELNFSQNKLTAFAIVPKDMLEFGPEWIERYVRLQLAEAMALKLEEGIVKGNGAASNQPYGLTKDLTYDSDGVTVTGAKEKTSSGTLTFADAQTTANELAQALTTLSTKENGAQVDVSTGVTLLVNPADQFYVKAQNTMQTVNGAWVTSLPFNVDVVASEFVDPDKAIFVVGSRYYAVQTGSVTIKSYDQTLALEDADVFIAKQFAHGTPDDNKVALVYDLNIAAKPSGDSVSSDVGA
ncbi:phage major capsid protein [Staphylococcus chromogenes]|uniref:Phage major capsid protein n=1 Tax=Staphylococcus chromogenes TaxID=46126 RepID=A0ABX5I789_STACR|nr:phage major capsid protein [Staphylococcus chromogenes]PTF40747.1 phage major capsid protein [Staphylococcus chromogenes]PTG68297.1 phage major capsid protein [Staphylococcus chromogenes]RIL89512.1 phage major capsid protein [Staphylococcus chromogenes]RIM09589.1 phage major capsid protein [Staphylococcus chromogenes]